MKKKVLSILLIISLMASMLMGLTACGNNDDDDKSSKSSRAEREQEILDEASDVYEEASSIVKENSQKLDELEISTFNQVFTSYEGSQSATDTKSLLDKVVTTNTANPDRAVTVEFNGDEYTDTSKIVELKTKIASVKKYDISFEYAQNGLIETIIISDGTSSSSSSDVNEVYNTAKDTNKRTSDALKEEEEAIKAKQQEMDDILNNFVY